MTVKERLQKILSRHGVASRRQAETLLTQGRVHVNGQAAALGDSADEALDEIRVDGRLLDQPPELVYLMLNKPRGYVTTLRDEQGRKNVAELVAGCGQRVYPVGRLDQYSEGLLLLTNDGALANRLMHPSGEIRKIYHVWVSGFREEALPRLMSSIVIDGKKTLPAKVRVLSRQGETAMLEFTLSEGRNRQIRRLCQSADLTVTRLKRVQEGMLELGRLAVGRWRFLTREEIESLKEKEIGEDAHGSGYPGNHT